MSLLLICENWCAAAFPKDIFLQMIKFELGTFFFRRDCLRQGLLRGAKLWVHTHSTNVTLNKCTQFVWKTLLFNYLVDFHLCKFRRKTYLLLFYVYTYLDRHLFPQNESFVIFEYSILLDFAMLTICLGFFSFQNFCGVLQF